MNNIRCEASRHIKNRKREHLKDKINERAMNSMNKKTRELYRGINKFKRVHQSRSNLVKDENGELLADFNTIVNRWKGQNKQNSLAYNLITI
jgi:hypothetical protein